ncbi:MAG: DUF4271 domain-containing protein [Muribaculaceae bacterium]|nr:DUF4271 domain-containing protein [Muribaculaceae bacterium]
MPSLASTDSIAARAFTDSIAARAFTDSVAARAAADSIAAQARADSIAAQARADSIAQKYPLEGILIEAPAPPPPSPPAVGAGGSSWVTGGLLLLFCIVALRFRNNYRYIVGLIRDLTEVRERHNMFDDTVRETSFLVLLNLLQGGCAGVVLAYALFDAPSPLQTALCTGACLVYTLVMWMAYSIVGNVFSDRVHTRMWVRGFISSQGLLSLPLLPVALLCLCYPGEAHTLILTGLGCLICAKLVFIWKGFRIFFTQISSWVLFLYYLCSLEIVPLILTAVGAMAVCSVIHI